MQSHQRIVVLVLALLIGATRFSAVAQSMWEWDEALFSSAVREYNVAAHNPHPPGYPLFIASAKFLRPLTGDDFRAVQAVVVLFSCLLFPAAFFLARAAGFRFGSALGGAVLCAFIPNVWYYGGTAFTDVPATVLAMAACALLLQGRESTKSYLLGTALLAISIGFRPQNLIIGLVPGLLATWKRGRQSLLIPVGAALLGFAIVAASYGGAALASSSTAEYVAAVKSQQEYVSRIDSFRNPGREPLRDLAKRFFVLPVEARALMVILTALALLSFLLSLLRLHRPVLLTFGIFGPFAVFAWLMLDPAAVSRYAVGYMPLYAFLAADVLGGGFVRRDDRGGDAAPRLDRAALAQGIGIFVLATSFVIWATPALRIVRNHDAPNVAAVKWVARNVPDRSTPVYVHAGLGPFSDYYLRGYQLSYFEDPSEIGAIRDTRGYAIDLDGSLTQPLVEWRWPHGRLWKLARRRYFEAEILPVTGNVKFVDGWYGEEGSGADTWRWMGRAAVLELPALPGKGRLQLRLGVPLDAVPEPPVVELKSGDRVLDRFVAREASLTRAVEIPSGGAPVTVSITTSAVAHAPGDPRDLGLRLGGVSWNPLR